MKIHTVSVLVEWDFLGLNRSSVLINGTRRTSLLSSGIGESRISRIDKLLISWIPRVEIGLFSRVESLRSRWIDVLEENSFQKISKNPGESGYLWLSKLPSPFRHFFDRWRWTFFNS
ncbi:unnamed protein product [Haemonchus placei]|uniref:Uncharacterized protein n=1 Tax=Haemonchus placei TaxID=6290 RepID=A0A3P7W297_HAEPC|nr:unnamed protein product [Haemonchus placei]